MACTLTSKMEGVGEGDFSKKSCGGWSENFDFNEGFCYGTGSFFEGGTGNFWRK